MTNEEVLALIEERMANKEFAQLVADRNDTEVAAELNKALPRRYVSRLIGAGTIVEALALPEDPRAGAKLLRQMRELAKADPLVDEGGIRLIDRGEWDVGKELTQRFLHEMADVGVIPRELVNRLVALSPPEYSVEITQDQVGKILNRRKA